MDKNLNRDTTIVNTSKPDETPTKSTKNKKLSPTWMKKGDYTVHILIEEVKNLISKHPDFLPLPVIKIIAFNESKRTSPIKDRCSEYTFNEHIYFQKSNWSAEILNSEKIVIEGYDYYNTKREDFFGIYEFDFEYVYTAPNHSLKNLWIALANPEADDITQVRGYLKLSISITHEKDEHTELNPDPSIDNDCIIPPQIKIAYKQLSISIYKAEELPDMDNLIGSGKKVNRRCNGYIECHYMGITKQTSVVDMENEVIRWDEIIDIPVSQPVVSQKIVCLVKDKNTVRKDNTVGSFELKISDILNNKYNNIQIVNIYGSTWLTTTGISETMNNNPEIGSRWKGRVFWQVSYQDADTPSSGVKKIIDENTLKTVYSTPRSNLWSVYAKWYCGYYLPEKDGKYTVRIELQDNSAWYPSKQAVNRNIDWEISKTLACQTLTDQVHELPDLFIYLEDDKKRQLCFQRLPASEFYLQNEIVMIKLFPEPCLGKVKDLYLSGILKMRITVYHSKDKVNNQLNLDFYKDGPDRLRGGPETSSQGTNQKSEDYDSDDLEAVVKKNVSASPQTESPRKRYTIVANVFMTRYLIPGDSDGSSDPFTVLTIYDQRQKTSVKNNSINGVWNECLVYQNIEFDIDDMSTWPVMLCTIMDQDLSSEDMWGYTYIWLSDSSFTLNSGEWSLPRWHQLYLEKSNQPQGQILLSFYIFDEHHGNWVNNISIVPKTTPYSVEINALGWRDWKPLSFLPVKKPFISFDLNSINVSSKPEDSLAPIKTQPIDSGNSPNINSVIKFDVKLPWNEIFIPEMQCEVYDHVLGGMWNQLLGVFIIPTKQVIHETNETLENDMKRAQVLWDEKERLQNAETCQDQNTNHIQNWKVDAPDTSESPIDKKDDWQSIKEDYELHHTRNKKGKEIKKPLVEANKPGSAVEIINTSLETERKHEEDTEFRLDKIICNDITDWNVMYQGKIDNNVLAANRFNSEWFVLKPSFMTYMIPGVNCDETSDYYYIENDREKPRDEYYFPLGYNKRNNLAEGQMQRDDDAQKMQIKKVVDSNDEKNKKHYRRIFGKELEKVEELGLGSPFTKLNLVKDKYRDKADSASLFEEMKNIESKIVKRYCGNINHGVHAQNGVQELNVEQQPKEEINRSFDIKQFGHFKGLMRIAEKNKMKEYSEFVARIRALHGGVIPKEFHFLTKFDGVSKHILTRRSVIIRVYILELNNLAKKDAFSESDPYIVIKLGNTVKVNEKDKKMDDVKDCKWYKSYDILTELPGNTSLTLQVMDYDPIFSDELIGETTIDIEDRYFDQKWQRIKNKPIETRQLYHHDYCSSQGHAIMWWEIFDKNERQNMQSWNISPEPESTLELRLIIWETENMECMDVEGTSDIYIISYWDQQFKRSTDIHFRCQEGNASFNWRMVIPVQVPRRKYELIFQVYDNDILARDDFICGGKLNLYRFIRDVSELDIPVTFNRAYQESLKGEERFSNVEFLSPSDDPDGMKFWVQMTKGGDNKGRVMCSLQVVPSWKREASPVGEGRDEPNIEPYLPPPVGRMHFTWNPFTMFNQLVGPKFRRKCCWYLCSAMCVLYLIVVIPYMINYVCGQFLNPFNYITAKKE